LQWEDGAVVNVPVVRPTQKQISEWLPEGMGMAKQHTHPGVKDISGQSEHEMDEGSFFQGRQVCTHHQQEE
jgi:hypothetical protein